jgi:uncharacterized protein YndB with AHSA1/START domain
MSTPDVPLRLELTFELPGTPEQVWDAIATANGISAWFIPTDVEEREGGAVCFHMGDEEESAGTVTGWEPPRRFAYVEPDWAALAGHEAADVTPLATEFLVEARSGGTCVVHIVTSSFGTGADWEQEFFDEMEKGWRPFFDNLRLYLTDFPGQQVTPMQISSTIPGNTDAVWSAMRKAAGVDEVGQRVEICGVTGDVERIGDEQLLLRLHGPVPGFLALFVFGAGDGETSAHVNGYLFSDDAAAFVERERPVWKSWLDTLATHKIPN